MKDLNFLLLIVFGTALLGYFLSKSSDSRFMAASNSDAEAQYQDTRPHSAKEVLSPHFTLKELEVIQQNISENNPAYYDYEIR